MAALRLLAPLAVVGLAVGLRLVDLMHFGFNSDEAVYAGQAAALADAPVLSDIFPVFRAHPLLFQFIVAVAYRLGGASDVLGRLVAVAVSSATVAVVYAVAARLYDRRTGLIAAIVLAVMPYHVVASRQVLLDGPMVLWATVSLYALACFGATGRAVWLYASGAAMGLTFLSKETGILMVGAIYAFLALSPSIKVRILHVFGSLAAMITIMSAFPLAVGLAGGGGKGTTLQYLVWQLFRRPNHDWDFYLTVVPPALGFQVLALAGLGLWLARGRAGWRERLLIVWMVVPIVFFQLWPTKGYQYLLPIAPPLAVLAARGLVDAIRSRPAAIRPLVHEGVVLAIGTIVLALSLLAPALDTIQPKRSTTFLAGSGGVPGGREVGSWAREHVPAGASFMTIGPSMANILKFYAQHQAFGLSVSPNPLHRNPSYSPVDNPDYQIRTAAIQYLVWDSYSAARSHVFSEKLLDYARKYNGRAVHTYTVEVETPDGHLVERPVIIVFEVRP
jgi:4-amino-4-deoxy-L-arabinose transferase-like glycosyltransferase